MSSYCTIAHLQLCNSPGVWARVWSSVTSAVGNTDSDPRKCAHDVRCAKSKLRYYPSHLPAPRRARVTLSRTMNSTNARYVRASKIRCHTAVVGDQQPQPSAIVPVIRRSRSTNFKLRIIQNATISLGAWPWLSLPRSSQAKPPARQLQQFQLACPPHMKPPALERWPQPLRPPLSQALAFDQYPD